MPKIKTVKGVRDRFKVTGSGKLMGFRAGRRHLLGSKRRKTKRQFKRRHVLAAVDTKKIRQLVPYQ